MTKTVLERAGEDGAPKPSVLTLAREGTRLAGEDPLARVLEDEFSKNIRAIREKCEEVGIPAEGYETFMKDSFVRQRARENMERAEEYYLHAKEHFPALAQALEEAVGLVKDLYRAVDSLSDEYEDGSFRASLDEARAFLGRVGVPGWGPFEDRLD